MAGAEVIRVDFARIGGLGQAIRTTVDSTEMAPDEAQRLRSLVEESGIFTAPPVISGVKPEAENVLYDLAVDVNGNLHFVEIQGGEPPERLRPLVDWLMDQSEKTVDLNFELRAPGRTLTAAIDSTKMARGNAETLRRLLDQSGFFNLPPSLSRIGEGRVSYRIWAQEGDRSNLVLFDDRSLPEGMRPLVDWLTNLAEGTVWINFEQAGVPPVVISTLNMPPERVDQLRSLIESSRFFDLPPMISGQKPGRIRYRVTMEACGVLKSVDVRENAEVGSLGPLLDFLRAEAIRALEKARCSVER